MEQNAYILFYTRTSKVPMPTPVAVPAPIAEAPTEDTAKCDEIDNEKKQGDQPKEPWMFGSFYKSSPSTQ